MKRTVSLWQLIALTFFMVSGGTYGTEEIVRDAGYVRAILILLVTPLLWSLPTALMVGELATAIPEEGGYYEWVRRALGDFWGFQEAWQSLLASVFDMAIYPTLFVAYLAKFAPGIAAGHRSWMIGVTFIAVSTLLNLAGSKAVGLSAFWMFLILSAPFALIAVLAPFKATPQPGPATHFGIMAGVLVAMWNYMGWDSASTIAAEVEEPQRNYPRAMLWTVLLVTGSYILPVAAVSLTGIAPSVFGPGAWADVAGAIGGRPLRFFVILGGMMGAFGMFNSMGLSYSRLPWAMARDKMLPGIFIKLSKRGVPWVAIIACAIGWALCLSLGFDRLISYDVLLTGASLILEFLALIVLRITQPDLLRPFRIPGGVAGAIVCAVLPTILLVVSAAGTDAATAHITELLLLMGFGAYFFTPAFKRKSMSA